MTQTDTGVAPSTVDGAGTVLSPAALRFVEALHERFAGRRDELLRRRQARRAQIRDGATLAFDPATAEIRDGAWSVPPPPDDLADRRVEITGPTDRKMAINALNSGARVWLADLEDANTPHWANVVSGQVCLADAVRRTLTYTSPEGKRYALAEDRPLATIVVRPRGWHLDEPHVRVDGRPAVGALVDFGLHFLHNAAALLERGSGPYFYLPKLESRHEARLWNDVFTYAQQALGVPHGSVRATVLVETIPAAFEMEEILFELRDHASGLNAGRWDYLFSIIKYFGTRGRDFVLPDRNQVTMTAPFMRAYTELLVTTCHRRGAYAIGGMAAFIPSRRDAEVNAAALDRVRQDKEREAGDGFDGSWVAHPDLVPVCRAAFDAALGDRTNQLHRRQEHVEVTAADLLGVQSTPGSITEAGLRNDIAVALRYIGEWLNGTGAVAIFNLMEDAATAEIARSQVWQWLRNGVALDTGQTVTPALVTAIADEELARINAERGDAERYATARELFDELTLRDDFIEFLTIRTAAHID
ncbi:malate synthase A [Dactylosporangium sp. AC04546]|uniref:malate synthase A n=1 Tax=Dactylosporangium sp. AC04546 TaxID=2862460 RepID=UPI001EE12CFF|nr:malate synthase A [Dactylosporangium sp. AC04546]WVK79521.1 malate synthase A [Dactylosporangium sp. AC04546]